MDSGLTVDAVEMLNPIKGYYRRKGNRVGWRRLTLLGEKITLPVFTEKPHT